MNNWAYNLVALVFAAAGVGLLFFSWHKRALARRWPVMAGWGLMLASLWLWSAGLGAEFGITVGLLVMALLAWGAVLLNADRRPAGDRTQQLTIGFRWPRPSAVLKHALLLALTIPVAGAASTLVGLTLTDWLPWSQINRLVLAALAMPLLWGCAVYWLCCDRKLLRPAATLFIAGTLSALYLFG